MSKSRGYCPACSPSKAHKSIFVLDYTSDMGWHRACTNCGHTKKCRKIKSLTADEIFETLTSDAKIKKVSERVKFHAFNPHGAAKTYSALCDQYANEALAKGIDAYEIRYHYSDFHVRKLYELSNSKRPKKWDVNYHIGAIKKDIETLKEGLKND